MFLKLLTEHLFVFIIMSRADCYVLLQTVLAHLAKRNNQIDNRHNRSYVYSYITHFSAYCQDFIKNPIVQNNSN